jgi:hypothetical protein
MMFSVGIFRDIKLSVTLVNKCSAVASCGVLEEELKISTSS